MSTTAPRRAGPATAAPGRLRGVLAYAAFPMIGAVTPLLAIPAISQQFGAPGWASIAVGQSVGAAASVAVELGWGLTGPQAVAATDRSDSLGLLASSIKSRLAVATVVVPITWFIVWLLNPPDLAAAALAASAMTLAGLSLNWFFVGLGSPARIFWSDALPRLVSILLGVVAITALGAPLVAFACCLLLGFVASPVIGMAMVRPRAMDFSRAEGVGSVIRRQAVAVAGRGLSAVYIGLPVALVQAWAPTAVPAFAAAERLTRMGLLVLQTVPNVLQRAVGAATRDARSLLVVAKQVLVLQTAVGVGAALACALALPTAVDLLFAGKVSVGFATSSAAACVVLFTSLSRATGMLLVARKRVPWISVSAGVAAASAFALLAILPSRQGPTGAMVSLAAAEALALFVQAFGLVRSDRRSAKRP
jgi:O-antigen/teichoic acid export membrane protein